MRSMLWLRISRRASLDTVKSRARSVYSTTSAKLIARTSNRQSKNLRFMMTGRDWEKSAKEKPAMNRVSMLAAGFAVLLLGQALVQQPLAQQPLAQQPSAQQPVPRPAAQDADKMPPMTLRSRIALPGVYGRMDHYGW